MWKSCGRRFGKISKKSFLGVKSCIFRERVVLLPHMELKDNKNLIKRDLGDVLGPLFFIDNNQWFVGRWKHTWDGV